MDYSWRSHVRMWYRRLLIQPSESSVTFAMCQLSAISISARMEASTARGVESPTLMAECLNKCESCRK
eukprot:1127479-Karenia_brevis.AAC.1